MDAREMFQRLKKEFEENFNKYKNEGYTLAEYDAIPFFSKEIGYREVNNWGTEESTDIHLLFLPGGWNLGQITVQTGAGINRIMENSIHAISENELVAWFEKQTNEDQKKMTAKAYEFWKKLESDAFKSIV